jgi:hypothetical protein
MLLHVARGWNRAQSPPPALARSRRRPSRQAPRTEARALVGKSTFDAARPMRATSALHLDDASSRTGLARWSCARQRDSAEEGPSVMQRVNSSRDENTPPPARRHRAPSICSSARLSYEPQQPEAQPPASQTALPDPASLAGSAPQGRHYGRRRGKRSSSREPTRVCTSLRVRALRRSATSRRARVLVDRCRTARARIVHPAFGDRKNRICVVVVSPMKRSRIVRTNLVCR